MEKHTYYNTFTASAELAFCSAIPRCTKEYFPQDWMVQIKGNRKSNIAYMTKTLWKYI